MGAAMTRAEGSARAWREALALEKRRTVPMEATAKVRREDGGHGRAPGVLFLATREEADYWESIGCAKRCNAGD